MENQKSLLHIVDKNDCYPATYYSRTVSSFGAGTGPYLCWLILTQSTRQTLTHTHTHTHNTFSMSRIHPRAGLRTGWLRETQFPWKVVTSMPSGANCLGSNPSSATYLTLHLSSLLYEIDSDAYLTGWWCGFSELSKTPKAFGMVSGT